jgi:hypothetical protein
LLEVAGEEVAEERGGLRFWHPEELDPHEVVREHVAAGDPVALAFDFVEQSEADFGELGLVGGELRSTEGGFEDRSA